MNKANDARHVGGLGDSSATPEKVESVYETDKEFSDQRESNEVVQTQHTGVDPLGKRALFWVPPHEPEGARSRTHMLASPLGKRALYSKATDSKKGQHGVGATRASTLGGNGIFLVECSRCHQASRIGLVDFLICQLPIGFWIPRGKYDRRMTCPSCRKRVWAGVSLVWDKG